MEKFIVHYAIKNECALSIAYKCLYKLYLRCIHAFKEFLFFSISGTETFNSVSGYIKYIV